MFYADSDVLLESGDEGINNNGGKLFLSLFHILIEQVASQV